MARDYDLVAFASGINTGLSEGINCAMYCNPRAYTRVIEPHPGGYFALALDRCEGCGKCIELCPCGFLSIRTSEHQDC